MSQLHELLAVEGTRKATWNTVKASDLKKLSNVNLFQGLTKRLKMIADSEENKVIEAAAKTDKARQTSVIDTLDYTLDQFAAFENLQAQKNFTNLNAKANVIVKNGDGTETTIFTDLPVDQLLGLEARLPEIKELLLATPTLDAAVNWTYNPSTRAWDGPTSTTTKTEKKIDAKVLYEATDKHPAQIKEFTADIVVGSFTETKSSGELTAVQKADTILFIDRLIQAVKEARMRANSTTVDVNAPKIGTELKKLIMAQLKESLPKA
jgi:hypothetical protein